MTKDEAYKVHIQYTFNAFCKIVIRHAAIDKILKLRRRWEREISLEYLTEEKFVPLSTTDEYFQVPDYPDRDRDHADTLPYKNDGHYWPVWCAAGYHLPRTV